MHGDQRNDEYAWLRDPDWQKVMQDPSVLKQDIRDYLEQENEYTAQWMQDTEQLQQTLYNEMKARIKEDDATVPDKDGNYYYYQRYETTAQHPLFCRYEQDDQEQLLLDAEALSRQYEYFDIGDCEHSPDHRYLAYSTDTKGSEFYTLYIVDLHSGVHLAETITNIQGDFVWAMDSKTIFYTTLDEQHRPDKVFRHALNTPRDRDVLVYQEKDNGFFVSLDRTESNRFILISAHDHTTSEVHYVDAYYPQQALRIFEPRQQDVEYSISDHDDRWYITTNADRCKDYKIMITGLRETQREYWQDEYNPPSGTLLVEVILFKDFLVRVERTRGLPTINICPFDKTRDHYAIAFDEEAYELDVHDGFEFDTHNLRFSYASMTTPRQVFDFDMHARERVLRKQQIIPSGHNPDEYITRRLFAAARDGAKIPISILHHRDTAIDGQAPLLLYGYGAYGNTMPASFSTHRLSLVNRGYVYAIAHIRGGMELGYDWYTQGKRHHKKNSFTDFIDCADFLVDQKYTCAGNITIHGGSAGGMLIGAVINLRPALFRTAIADVPFVDVLNTMCDDSLPLTPPEWPEWGNPLTSSQDYQYIKSYSPYDNVRAQDYPHVLITAGLTDPRVTYWEPAKWTARLRALKTDNHAVLLKTHMEAGHAGVSGRFERLRDIALMYAFVLKLSK